MSGELSVALVLTLLLVFVVVAPAVGGLAVCVELDDLPGMMVLLLELGMMMTPPVLV